MRTTKVSLWSRETQTKQPPANPARFIGECGTVSGALDAIGRTHAWVRWHREKDPTFADAEQEAFAKHADTLEQAAIDRATGRKLRQVTYKGQLQYQHDPATGALMLDDEGNPVPVMEEVMSDRLLEQQLEATKPEKYTKTRRLDARILTRRSNRRYAA